MTKDRIRSILLAALMILSVTVGTIGVASAATSTEVNLSPTEDTVNTGSTVTYDIVVEQIDNGVQSYEFNVSVNETSTAKITNFSLVGTTPDSTGTSVTWGSNNGSLDVGVAAGDHNNGVIASITVTGENAGVANLSLSQVVVGDSSFSSYTITSTGDATVRVTQPASNFEVVSVEAPSRFQTGTGYTATVTVNNTGVDSGTKDVTYELFNSDTGQVALTKTKSVQLGVGETKSVDFEVSGSETSNLATGNYTHRVATPDDAAGDPSDSLDATIAGEIGFIQGTVKDTQNRVVEGEVVASLDLDDPTSDNFTATINPDDGSYTLQLPALSAGETFEVVVNTTGDVRYQEFSTRNVLVEPGETDRVDITLQPLLVPDQIEVSPTSATALANGEDTITYTVTVFDQNGDRLQDSTVVADEGADDVTFVGSTSKTTDSNGEVTFTVRSSTVQTATIDFEALGAAGANPTVTATAQFILAGQGTVSGQVFNVSSTSGLSSAGVYAVFDGRFEQNQQSYSIDVSSYEDALPASQRDDTIYIRLHNNDTGQIVDNDDYRVSITDGSAERIGLVDELNVTNPTIGSGFAAVDRDGDGLVNVSVTPLRAANYTVQISPAQVNNSRAGEFGDSTMTAAFENASEFRTFEELTMAATEARFANSSADPVDMANEDGDFLLTNLYTDGQDGQAYTLVAEASGFSTDFADVNVTEDGFEFEDQEDTVFALQPEAVNLIYRLNVTAADDTGAFSDSVVMSDGQTRDIQVTVEVKEQGEPDSEYEPIQDTGRNVDLTVELTNGADLGDLSDGTTGDSVTIPTSASPQDDISFTAEQDVSGNVTVDATIGDSDVGVESDSANITVQTTVALEGDIVDADTGDPLEDIQVEAFEIRNGTPVDTANDTAISAASGDVTLNVPSGSQYRIEATDPSGVYQDAAVRVDARGAIGTVAFSIAMEEATSNNSSNGEDGNSGTDFLSTLDDSGNGDGTIGFQEVLSAIDAFNNDEQIGGLDVTFTRVLDAITAFNQGTSV